MVNSRPYKYYFALKITRNKPYKHLNNITDMSKNNIDDNKKKYNNHSSSFSVCNNNDDDDANNKNNMNIIVISCHSICQLYLAAVVHILSVFASLPG